MAKCVSASVHCTSTTLYHVSGSKPAFNSQRESPNSSSGVRSSVTWELATPKARRDCTETERRYVRGPESKNSGVEWCGFTCRFCFWTVFHDKVSDEPQSHIRSKLTAVTPCQTRFSFPSRLLPRSCALVGQTRSVHQYRTSACSTLAPT